MEIITTLSFGVFSEGVGEEIVTGRVGVTGEVSGVGVGRGLGLKADQARKTTAATAVITRAALMRFLVLAFIAMFLPHKKKGLLFFVQLYLF